MNHANASTKTGASQQDGMTSSSSRIALLGGPNSGKSTYLGSLLDALEAERIDHLRMEMLPADTTALRRLTDPLLDGKYPQRTEFGNITPLMVRLRTGEHTHNPDQQFVLQVADYSGEELTALFDDREGWSSAWQQRAESAAVLLFVRPKVLTELPRLRSQVTPDQMARWQALKHGPATSAPMTLGERIPVEQAPPEYLPSEADTPPTLLPEDAVRVPTVLGLIELLQFIRHARGLAPGERPAPGTLRIALMVSAWDSVPDTWTRQGPARFIAQHLPLLEDFLWSNFYPEDVFRFGLSATGGDLTDPVWAKTFMDDPQGYIEWVGLEGKRLRHPDIALPLYWALFGEAAWNLVQ